MKFRYDGVEFGGQHGTILVRNFTDGQAERRSNHTPWPQRNGVIPGKTFLGGRTWEFDLSTNADDIVGAFATEALLSKAWNDEEVLQTPNLKVPLSYDPGDGIWRRVYGKPGEYVGPVGDVVTKQGAGKITCNFDVMDPRYFDDLEKWEEISIIPASGGGLRAPLRAPLAAGYAGEPRAGFVTNDGDARSPLKAEFFGPVKDPYVRSEAGWWIGLNGTLAHDVTVTVDALQNTVIHSNGGRVAGMLIGTRLSRAELPPGQSELSFGGEDVTGTAKVRLYWRDAHTSIGG